MAQTLISATTTLCPVAEFLKRVDKSAVALLASDTAGVPVPDGSLATNGNIVAALIDATGLFESAVMMGGKYSSDDLALLKATTCGAQGMMFRIISDLAWVYLFERRPNMNAPSPPSLQRSLEWMDMISQGKRIFAFTEAQDATVMSRVVIEPDDIEEANGVVFQAKPYFGIRSNEQR